jgi:hypothetical protein
LERGRGLRRKASDSCNGEKKPPENNLKRIPLGEKKGKREGEKREKRAEV